MPGGVSGPTGGQPIEQPQGKEATAQPTKEGSLNNRKVTTDHERIKSAAETYQKFIATGFERDHWIQFIEALEKPKESYTPDFFDNNVVSYAQKALNMSQDKGYEALKVKDSDLEGVDSDLKAKAQEARVQIAQTIVNRVLGRNW